MSLYGIKTDNSVGSCSPSRYVVMPLFTQIRYLAGGAPEDGFQKHVIEPPADFNCTSFGAMT